MHVPELGNRLTGNRAKEIHKELGTKRSNGQAMETRPCHLYEFSQQGPESTSHEKMNFVCIDLQNTRTSMTLAERRRIAALHGIGIYCQSK